MVRRLFPNRADTVIALLGRRLLFKSRVDLPLQTCPFIATPSFSASCLGQSSPLVHTGHQGGGKDEQSKENGNQSMSN